MAPTTPGADVAHRALRHFRQACNLAIAFALVTQGQNHFDFPVRVSGVLMVLTNPQPSLIQRHGFLHAPPSLKRAIFCLERLERFSRFFE
jgi:hypothetical protein